MNKILSICIPSYNMEEYLHRCVDSMIVEEVLDKLEIIIVNDGSKDGTLAIANSYKERYPQSVVVVDKPNGHYGSCINAALKVATGKYFRIVDADDWVDNKALTQVVNRLSEIDVDCVWANYTIIYYNGGTRTFPMDLPYDKVLDLAQYTVPSKCMRMHCLLYSRDLLQRIGYVQTEGICYTDVEYAYFPLSCAKNIYFMDVYLYQYFVGREGQSMTEDSLIKNNGHYVKLLESLKQKHKSGAKFFNNNEIPLFSISIQDTLLAFALPMYLLYYKYDQDKERLFRELMSFLKKKGTLVFPDVLSKNKISMINLWYNSGKLSRLLMIPFQWYEKKRRHL